MKKLMKYLIGLLILLVNLTACNRYEEQTPVSTTTISQPTATLEPTEAPTVEPTITPTTTPTAEPTIEPSIEPTIEPTAEPDGLTADKISLDSSPLGVANWSATLIPASNYDASQPPGPQGLPEHIVITFDNDDPASRIAGDPILYIIPVNAYTSLWEDASNDSVNLMMNDIAEMADALPLPHPTSGMPVLPYEEITGFNDVAVQVKQPITDGDSASQAGYRFIGRFMQSLNPVTNWQLQYIYQGFSADGEYLISFFYPIRTDALPDKMDTATVDAFEADMTGHINDSIAMLNKLETGDWEPDITAFDAVIASLQIEGVHANTGQALHLPAELVSETWQWASFIDPISGTQIIPEPERYQLTLNTDGSYEVQADCNSGSSTYTIEGNSISLMPAPITRAACPPDSLADAFMQNLEVAAIYFMQDGDLFFDLMYDSGTMRLTAVNQPIDKPQITAESIWMDTQGLAKSWTWKVINDTPATPPYILLTFDGVDAKKALAEGLPHIAIFPVEGYISIGGSRVEDEVVRLQTLIDGAPPSDPMPILPPSSDFVEQWVHFDLLDFNEGTGVRYVSDSINQQGIGTQMNDGSSYYYQGLTEDGRFYISFVWPVHTSSLPNDAWEPNLSDLDAMVASLRLYE